MGSESRSERLWPIEDVIDGLRVIAGRRGMNITRGDVLVVEEAARHLQAKSSETRESLQLVPVQSRNEILEEAALAIENADTRTLDEIGAAYIVRALQVRSK